jgi:hypothetical protein
LPESLSLRRICGEQVQILAITLGFEVIAVDESQRRRVDAVAQPPGFRWAVGEYVP